MGVAWVGNRAGSASPSPRRGGRPQPRPRGGRGRCREPGANFSFGGPQLLVNSHTPGLPSWQSGLLSSETSSLAMTKHR